MLKSIIESYDGLAELRTINAAKGEVVILALEDTETYIREIFESVKKEIRAREVPLPEGLENDWLLGEFLSEL